MSPGDPDAVGDGPNDGAPQPPKPGGESGLKVPDLLLLAIVLFPGFLTERVSEYFAASPKVADIQLVSFALAATLINLGITLLLVRPVLGDWLRWTGKNIVELVMLPSFIIAVSLVAVANGMLWAYVDAGNLIFGTLKVTDRVSRADPWDVAFLHNRQRECPDVIKDKERQAAKAKNQPQPKSFAPCPWYVRVVTKDGEVYHGNPELYSQGGNERALYLEFARREVPKESAAAAKNRRTKPDDPAAKPSADPRTPVVCLPVGTPDGNGGLLLLKDQIRLIEFRPERVVQVKGGTDVALKYECGPYP
jgi:hypothetical protein